MLATVRIRSAAAADVAALPAVERIACARFDAYGLAEVMTTIVTPVEDLHAGARDGSLFVADDGGTLVGFALSSPLDGGLHLDELDVLPSHGRRGIGRALVEAVVDLARRRGLARVTLSTLRSIPWNAPWYATLGFRPMTDAELTPVFRALLAHEAERGLPMDDRVLLRKDV
jgi:GNAT superfamily N-acetyltransferase